MNMPKPKNRRKQNESCTKWLEVVMKGREAKAKKFKDGNNKHGKK